MVATPEYLKHAGTPVTLDDLVLHECVQFELPNTWRRVPWSFRVNGRLVEVETRGSLTVLEDYLATATLAKCGGGLMQAYRFTVQDELEAGALVEVLREYGKITRPLLLLYPYAPCAFKGAGFY